VHDTANVSKITTLYIVSTGSARRQSIKQTNKYQAGFYVIQIGPKSDLGRSAKGKDTKINMKGKLNFTSADVSVSKAK
jgi:hypothetical protein